MRRVLCVLSALALVLVGAAMAGDTGKTTTKPAGTSEKGTAAMSDAKAMTAMAATGQLMKLADLKWQDATGYAAGVKVAHVMTGPQEIGIPPKAVHWLTAKTETIVYANALGPEGIDYSNPNEDPRKAQASR